MQENAFLCRRTVRPSNQPSKLWRNKCAREKQEFELKVSFEVFSISSGGNIVAATSELREMIKQRIQRSESS